MGWRPSCCFFFSSRRRHTRCGRDWSSDVCSSDLAQCTDTPWTGLLFWSVAITRYGYGRVASTVSVWPSPEAAGVLASWVAPWIWAVALNLTGDPVRPVLAAVAVWAPAFAPRVQVAVAMPFASLLLCGVIDPLPVPGVQVAGTAARGVLLASRTITARGGGSAR